MAPTPRTPPSPAPPDDAPPEDAARFRQTLIKVMSMQVVALLALWWLQTRYAR
jgi:hypothetical protein